MREQRQFLAWVFLHGRPARAGDEHALFAAEITWSPELHGEEVYATGADSTQLRPTLRVASLRKWHWLSLDVKSAFLLAPKAQGELVIVKPPRILVEASLAAPDEHWVVTCDVWLGDVAKRLDRDAELEKMMGG